MDRDMKEKWPKFVMQEGIKSFWLRSFFPSSFRDLRDDHKIPSTVERWFGWESSCEQRERINDKLKKNFVKLRWAEQEVIKKERSSSRVTMPSPATDVMDTSSQYSSCETLDSHRSSELDEKNEVNGNDSRRPGRKVKNILSKPWQTYSSSLSSLRSQLSIQNISRKNESHEQCHQSQLTTQCSLWQSSRAACSKPLRSS